MIWHLFEIWASLFVAFVVGCLLGVALYEWLDRGRFATAQGTFADGVGDTIDRIKGRLGVGAVWRPAVRPTLARPLPRAEAPVRYVEREEEEEAPVEARAPAFDWERHKGRYRDPDLENWDEGDTELLDDAELEPELDFEGGYETPEEMADDEPEIALPPEVDELAMRPVGLATPRNGVPDDLQRIRGIGKRNEELLNGLGIFHFGQIAAWTPAETRWVGAFLAFPERIERDDWVGQATILASGGDTGYVKAADRRRPKDDTRDK